MNSIFILMLIILSACSSLSKEDCASTNWQKKGHKDGSHGVNVNKLADYKAECAEHGLTVESAQYTLGHKQGLVYFCTYKNGLDLGLAGEDFSPFCSSTDPAFNRGYEEGYRVFKIQELERQEEARLEKKREEAKNEALRALKNEHGDDECSFDSDCKQEDQCNFTRCEKSGQTCHFNSDCESTEGRCETYSRQTSFNDRVEIRSCRFR